VEQYSEILEKGEEPIKFAIVGISGIFVNFAILFFSKEILQWSDEVSLALGIIFSVTTNYILNRIWTFQSSQPILSEYFKYIATNFVGFAIQYIVAYAVVVFSPIDNIQIPLLGFKVDIIYFGSMLGILIGFISNFLFSKFFVFNSSKEQEEIMQ
jgi:putative flippase GtrA